MGGVLLNYVEYWPSKGSIYLKEVAFGVLSLFRGRAEEGIRSTTHRKNGFHPKDFQDSGKFGCRDLFLCYAIRVSSGWNLLHIRVVLIMGLGGLSWQEEKVETLKAANAGRLAELDKEQSRLKDIVVCVRSHASSVLLWQFPKKCIYTLLWLQQDKIKQGELTTEDVLSADTKLAAEIDQELADGKWL